MMNFHFYNPTRLLFGSGKIGELGAQKLPGKKALLLLSAGKSAKTSGALDKTVEQLKAVLIDYDWQQLNIDNLCELFDLSSEEREHYFGEIDGRQ